MAEPEGFEPSIGCPIHAFQACAIDHSATAPRAVSSAVPPRDMKQLSQVGEWAGAGAGPDGSAW